MSISFSNIFTFNSDINNWRREGGGEGEERGRGREGGGEGGKREGKERGRGREGGGEREGEREGKERGRGRGSEGVIIMNYVYYLQVQLQG